MNTPSKRIVLSHPKHGRLISQIVTFNGTETVPMNAYVSRPLDELLSGGWVEVE